MAWSTGGARNISEPHIVSDTWINGFMLCPRQREQYQSEKLQESHHSQFLGSSRAQFRISSEEGFSMQLGPLGWSQQHQAWGHRHRTLVDALGQLQGSLQTFKTSWKPLKKWLETLKEKFYNNAESESISPSVMSNSV